MFEIILSDILFPDAINLEKKLTHVAGKLWQFTYICTFY